MNYYDTYIIIIFILKISILILFLTNIEIKLFGDYFNIGSKITYWNDRIDFLFKILTAILLFYIFNPYYDNTHMIDEKTKILFYFLGLSLIISANYNAFIVESVVYSYYATKEEKNN